MLEFDSVDLDGLEQVAKRIASELRSESWFNVSLIGDMGAGKTTFSRQLLYALGVDSSVAVTSPTFTYLNEYQTTDDKLIAHLDLYRAEAELTLEDLGASDIRSFWGILVEWPERLGESPPTHEIRIEFEATDKRLIQFQSLSSESP